jgi:hypothetical protein
MNILLYICYVILIGVILKLFDSKQTNNDKIIKIIIIIGIGLFIIMLLMPNKNIENKNLENFGVCGQGKNSKASGQKNLKAKCKSSCDCASSCCAKSGPKKGKCVLFQHGLCIGKTKEEKEKNAKKKQTAKNAEAEFYSTGTLAPVTSSSTKKKKKKKKK